MFCFGGGGDEMVGKKTHSQKSSHVHDKGGLLFLTESKAVLPTMVGNRIESSYVIPQ